MRRTQSLDGQKKVIVCGIKLFEEKLPFPYVHYPNHYGSFIGFSQNRDAYPILCSCSKPATLFAKKCSAFFQQNYSSENGGEIASSKFFPSEISRRSNVIGWDAVNFESGLCHRCNQIIPSASWCLSMYGGLFKQNYGWYIEQNRFRLGLYFGATFEIAQNCPEELAELASKLILITNERNHLTETGMESCRSYKHFVLNESVQKKINQMDKDAAKIERKIDNFIENETRKEFGFSKIGEGWIGESILAKLVRSIYPNETIERHYRPAWLEGLELDIFISSKKLGFEYQGQQHYFPVKHWGGQKALKELQLRDRKKKRICDRRGVKLIEVSFRDPLTEDFLKEKVFELQTKRKMKDNN
ncbi:hypothetical protein N9X12_02070 [Alphaproteobacteria bacterium]|nr:hypothetical protein [Alphaproteobacteria bacterium]